MRLYGLTVASVQSFVGSASLYVTFLFILRDLRQLVEGRDLQGFDLGPDESELQMSDPELVSAQQKEINRLREDLTQTSSHLATLELRVGLRHLATVELRLSLRHLATLELRVDLYATW